MASDVDDITMEYEEDGILLVKELDKEILSKGAWTTILFRYQQWDKRKKEYSDDSYAIRRYQKVHGEYMQKSKFNISSSKQAEKIVSALQRWMKKQLERQIRYQKGLVCVPEFYNFKWNKCSRDTSEIYIREQ